MDHSFLSGSDFVGITFWIVSIAMWAATIFFFYEGMRVSGKWRTSMVVAGLITFIAAVHYMYMREYWVEMGESPVVYRYIDWVLTVPLQMVEFYLILIAAGAASIGVNQAIFANGANLAYRRTTVRGERFLQTNFRSFNMRSKDSLKGNRPETARVRNNHLHRTPNAFLLIYGDMKVPI